MVPVGARFSPTLPDRYWCPRKLLFFQGVKLLGCGVEHTLSSSAELKKEYSYTSTISLVFMTYYRTNFTFNLQFYLTILQVVFHLLLSSRITKLYFILDNLGNGKAIPLQPWTGPEGSRRLRLPDFKTIGT